MTDETISATTIINAPAEAIFAVLADPAKHAAIDGTGWVREPLDGQHLTAPGQVFRMAMYNDNVPGGHYRMANQVQVLDPPRAISWEPGMDTGDFIAFNTTAARRHRRPRSFEHRTPLSLTGSCRAASPDK